MLLQLQKSGHSIIKRHTFYINKSKKGKEVGEGTEIGTDIDILLSSFNATDANHEKPGEREARAGFSFSKQSVFPLQGWRFAEMDGDRRPGRRNPREPTESRNVRRPEDPAPCPYPPGERHCFKTVGLLSLKERSKTK